MATRESGHINERLAKRLKALRLSKGMTRGEVAKKARIHVNSLDLIEKGFDLKLTTFLSIAQALEVDPAGLLQ